MGCLSPAAQRLVCQLGVPAAEQGSDDGEGPRKNMQIRRPVSHSLIDRADMSAEGFKFPVESNGPGCSGKMPGLVGEEARQWGPRRAVGGSGCHRGVLDGARAEWSWAAPCAARPRRLVIILAETSNRWQQHEPTYSSKTDGHAESVSQERMRALFCETRISFAGGGNGRVAGHRVQRLGARSGN